MPVAISIPVNDLQPLTTYHFRVVAANTAGTATGNDASFSSETADFTLTTTFSDRSRGAWGDYDNDGDLDLMMVKGTVGGSLVQLQVNNGNGTFSAGFF